MNSISFTNNTVSASDILVVIPTYREEAHIEACIRSLITDVDEGTAIIVADGMSDDDTVKIVKSLQEEFPNLHLINNPKRLQSVAINLAVAEFPTVGDGILVRCDAHSLYPPNFVRDVVARLQSERAASVVIPMDAVGETCFEKANAWIVDTPLGSGGAAHRGGKASGYVDHGHHAGFDLKWFRKLNGYDEVFSHNEDAEYDHRLDMAGGNIFLDADIRIKYVPRGSVKSLIKQYFNYGKGRARTCLKHAKALKLRQMLPILLVFALIGGLVLGQVHAIFLMPIAVYVALLTIVSLVISFKQQSACGLWCGPILACMHLGWGFGFLAQVINSRLSRPE